MIIHEICVKKLTYTFSVYYYFYTLTENMLYKGNNKVITRKDINRQISDAIRHSGFRKQKLLSDWAFRHTQFHTIVAVIRCPR